MDVVEAIRERRTIGAFRDDPVPRGLVEELIDSAVWAPNHKHTEPWRFHVVQGDARDALADAVWAELEAAGASPAKDPRSKLKRAPLFVAVTQTASPDDPVRDLEDYAACCCATQNLLLAAHARGLAAKWSTGALALSSAAKRWFGIAEQDRIVGYIYLGYAPKGVRIPPAQPLPQPRRLADVGILRTRRTPSPPLPNIAPRGGDAEGRGGVNVAAGQPASSAHARPFRSAPLALPSVTP